MTTAAATRLLAFYPRRWRARYGDEFAHVLQAQKLTLKLALDVVGGAVDAHINGGSMTEGMMKRCAAGGPHMSTEDAWRAAWMMIGSSLTFAGLYIWAKMNFPDGNTVDAYGVMGYPAALLVTMPFYWMKDHSTAAKVVIVGGCLAILATIAYVTTLI